MKVKSKNFSIIDKDMRVEGTLDTSGKLIVRGTVIGELRADTLLIDKGGAVQAAARVADMTIGGRFDGEIEASGREGARVDNHRKRPLLRKGCVRRFRGGGRRCPGRRGDMHHAPKRGRQGLLKRPSGSPSKPRLYDRPHSCHPKAAQTG